MINILMNKKRGLYKFRKLTDDGDPWAPNNLLTPEQEKKKQNKNTVGPRWAKQQTRSSGPNDYE